VTFHNEYLCTDRKRFLYLDDEIRWDKGIPWRQMKWMNCCLDRADIRPVHVPLCMCRDCRLKMKEEFKFPYKNIFRCQIISKAYLLSPSLSQSWKESGQNALLAA
jgi:hypothetical protein